MTELAEVERLLLLSLARRAAEASVTAVSPPRERFQGALAAPRGAFVTLKRRADDELRGCIGRIEPRDALGTTVAEVAAAATQDRRFERVTAGELRLIRIEVSVLTPPVPIAPDVVQVGRHGLIVRHEDSSGLLLPQVAVEHGWDRDTLLGQTCRKAGLALDAWRDPRTTLMAFTAEVFSEL